MEKEKNNEKNLPKNYSISFSPLASDRNIKKKISSYRSTSMIIRKVVLNEPMMKKGKGLSKTSDKLKLPPLSFTGNQSLESITEFQRKSKKGFCNMTQLKPSNIQEEKAKFYSENCNYNPQFVYRVKEIKLWYSKPHKKYLDQALKILNSALFPFKGDAKLYEQSGGQLLTKEESQIEFQNYIAKLGLSQNISLEFCEDPVVMTYVDHLTKGQCKVVIGLPIRYRAKRMLGVLNHEIGTHILRKFNDRSQIWHKKRKKFNLTDFMMIEEGLAGINQHIALVNFF